MSTSTAPCGADDELQNVASGFREWQAKWRFGRKSLCSGLRELFAAFLFIINAWGRGSDAVFLLPIAPVDREHALLPGPAFGLVCVGGGAMTSNRAGSVRSRVPKRMEPAPSAYVSVISGSLEVSARLKR